MMLGKCEPKLAGCSSLRLGGDSSVCAHHVLTCTLKVHSQGCNPQSAFPGVQEFAALLLQLKSVL